LAVERKVEMQYRWDVTSRRQNKNSAFTLTELLVVTATVGILAALLLPAISQSKKRAQQIQCVSNLHQLGIGIQNFIADNHAYPSFFENTNKHNPVIWFVQLETGGLGFSKPPTNNWVETGVWRCPSAQWPHVSVRSPMSYGYNTDGMGDHTNALGLGGHFISYSKGFAPIGESEIVSPSEMMVIGDDFPGGVFFEREPRLADSKTAYSRHQGKANVVFCDDHVESPTLPFLFADTSDAALSRWNRDHLPHREKLSP
jgi:prepilin-type processing-associated H-X9-DG protein